MNKKALSAIVATIILVALGVFMTVIIYAWNSSYIRLSPPNVDCTNVKISLEVYSPQTNRYSLAITNYGNVELYGGILNKIPTTGTENLCEKVVFPTTLKPGQTTEVLLSCVENMETPSFKFYPEIKIATIDGVEKKAHCKSSVSLLLVGPGHWSSQSLKKECTSPVGCPQQI